MLHEDKDMDWCTYNYGKPLSARQLAKFMSAYKIKSKTVRMTEEYTPRVTRCMSLLMPLRVTCRNCRRNCQKSWSKEAASYGQGAYSEFLKW